MPARDRSAAAVLISIALALVPAGGPAAQQAQGFRSFPYLVSAGDLDGDGVTDTVSYERTPAEHEVGSVAVGGMEPVITARRGRDGVVLWREDLEATLVLPARLGLDAEPGILVVEGPVADGYPFIFGFTWSSSGFSESDSVEARPLVLTALSGDGDVLWTRTFDPGLSARAALVVGSGYEHTGAAHRVPAFAGLHRSTGGAARIAVTFTTGQRVPGQAAVTTEVMVLDGRDGQETTSFTVAGEDTRSRARVVGDLDGDGLDDLVVMDAPVSGALSAFSSADGRRLWSGGDDLVPRFVPQVEDLGDVTGDGADDFLVRGLDEVFAEGYPVRHSLVDGASGAVRFVRVADEGGLAPVGDVTGDGAAEFLLLERLSSGGLLKARYILIGTRGENVRLRTYLVEVPEDACCGGLRLQPAAGDLDGDGIADAAHELIVTMDDGTTFRRGIAVSGRSLEPLFQGAIGEPLKASLDGEGDDLVEVRLEQPGTLEVTAQDGATGAPLWTRNFPVDPRWWWVNGHAVAADLDGDGAGELVLSAYLYRSEECAPGALRSCSATAVLAWVFRGSDGSLLWSA